MVTPDYLRTLGIALRQGRYLDRGDTAGTPSVLLVNETMARQYWPNENPVGTRIRMDSDWTTIVGVVGDIKTAGLDVPAQAETYWPAAQAPRAATSLAIHTRGDPAKLAAAVVREIHAVDDGLPILQVSTMDEILDREVFGRRAQTDLLAIFAGVALLLAALGIYGVLAYAVAQRTQEIGIRMALGARPKDVLLSIAGQGLRWSAIGILIGVGCGLALTRLLSKMLFAVSATDPMAFVGAAVVLLAVAWVASYIPARRAMKLDPIAALREE